MTCQISPPPRSLPFLSAASAITTVKTIITDPWKIKSECVIMKAASTTAMSVEINGKLVCWIICAG